MLVLTREPEESIVVFNDVLITVLGISGQQCRIGVAAPPEVPIHRLEIFNRIRRDIRDGIAPPDRLAASAADRVVRILESGLYTDLDRTMKDRPRP